jgi:hypothetical protein
MQEIGGALRVGGGAEDCALVGFHDLHPGRDVERVIVAHFWREAEIAGQEG